jgi:CBS domain-containing protein
VRRKIRDRACNARLGDCTACGMTSKRSSVSQLLPVHRSTLLGPERPQVTFTVHCPVDDRSVAAGQCEECSRCETYPSSLARSGATIECRVVTEAPDAVGHVHDVMESVYSVTTHASLSHIAALFASPAIRIVPVTSEAGVPLGAISRRDLLGAESEGPGSKLEAGAIMTPLPFTLPDVARLSDAIALMTREGIDAVPIVDPQGAIVGVVTAVGIAQRTGEPSRVVLEDGIRLELRLGRMARGRRAQVDMMTFMARSVIALPKVS